MRDLLRAALSVLLLAGGAPAWSDPISDAESLVRELYYEGVPYDAARALDDAGVARLGEMLSEPEEVDHHGNIVSALGMSGHPRAFELLERYAVRPLQGEVDRATFRARTRVASAMGHLAHDDGRALRWLLRQAGDRPSPGWSFRHHRGEKLATLLEEQVLSGLAITGAPEARTVLQRERDGARGSGVAAERRRRHVDALQREELTR